MKLFEKIKNDPRVESIWNEGSWTPENDEDDGGWWVSLKDGFEWFGALTIHERTLTNVLKALRQVKKTPKS